MKPSTERLARRLRWLLQDVETYLRRPSDFRRDCLEKSAEGARRMLESEEETYRGKT